MDLWKDTEGKNKTAVKTGCKVTKLDTNMRHCKKKPRE